MSNIPNLFIIGAPKTGTTALANSISQHDEIFISKLKEPTYFDARTFYDFKEDYPIKSLDKYLDYFSAYEANNSKYKLDASVFNMYSEKSINEILNLSPDAKFIILLRDPVDASVSMHKQRLKYPSGRMRELSNDFMECWRMLPDRKSGKKFPKNCRNRFLFRYDLLYSYEKYIPYLLLKIQPENLFIGCYDEYKNDPILFFKSLFKFLGIKAIQVDNSIYNESYIVKKSYLLATLQFFYKMVSPTIRKFYYLNDSLFSLKKSILNYYKIKNKNKNKVNDLSEVKAYFKNTYKYMERIKGSK